MELLRSGVEVDAGVDANGTSALLHAISNKKFAIVRLLLRHGASPEHVNTHGISPYMCCWDTSDDRDSCSSLDLFNLLCETADLDITAVNRHKQTTLHRAAMLGAQKSQIDTLVSLGSNIDHVDSWGLTPMHRAVLSGNYAAFTALEILRPQNIMGGGFLHVAVLGQKYIWLRKTNSSRRLPSGYERIIEHLLRHRADLDDQIEFSRAFLRNFTPSELQHDICERAITVYDLVAANGPALEAWFLDVLRRCGFLDLQEHIGRLCDMK